MKTTPEAKTRRHEQNLSNAVVLNDVVAFDGLIKKHLVISADTQLGHIVPKLVSTVWRDLRECQRQHHADAACSGVCDGQELALCGGFVERIHVNSLDEKLYRSGVTA